MQACCGCEVTWFGPWAIELMKEGLLRGVQSPPVADATALSVEMVHVCLRILINKAERDWQSLAGADLP
jgi:hypothetical protein